MLGDDPPQALEDFANRLVELWLASVALQHLGQDGFELFVDDSHSHTRTFVIGHAAS